MDLGKALAKVYELAEQNALDSSTTRSDEDLNTEALEQREALNTVHDFIVNQFGDNDWHVLVVDPQQFHTIIAALRFYQEKGQGSPYRRSYWIHHLATGGDEDVTSLNTEDIDDLVYMINTGG